MRSPYPHMLNGLTEKIEGPWPCERCGEVSQFALIRQDVNRVFCRNERCGYERIIDKRRQRIVEDDGTQWEWDDQGNKRRVTNQ